MPTTDSTDMRNRSNRHTVLVLILLLGILAAGAAPTFAAEPSRSARRDAGGSMTLSEAIAWQVALDRTMFSPGLIDGRLGPKSTAGLAAFQAANGLSVTGQPDEPTRIALGIDPASATRTLTLTAADEEAVGPNPKTWPEKSRCKRLGYKSLAALAAERGHCTQALLARLNPRVDLGNLRAGDTLVIPNVSDTPRESPVARLEVNLAAKTIRPIDRKDRSLGLLHCSIAKDRAKRPAGRTTVRVVSPNPVYVFDPKMWPEVKGINRKLLIPPGPRNPVGLFWIGLSLPGYGIHGTPEPEMIGKTGSHGCFRLANWDAVRLGRRIQPGIPVEFVTAPSRQEPRAKIDPSTIAQAPSGAQRAPVSGRKRATSTRAALQPSAAVPGVQVRADASTGAIRRVSSP